MNIFRPVLLLVIAALAVVGMAACSEEEHHEAAEGQFIEVGDLEYRVVFSRLLNIYDVEDRHYLADQEPPPEDHSYLGVFVQIENQSEEEPADIPDELIVGDTEGNEFEPLDSGSVFELDLGGELGPGEQAPALDSPAQTGPIQGSLILYEVPEEVTENRPLELMIPGNEEDARVELDI